MAICCQARGGSDCSSEQLSLSQSVGRAGQPAENCLCLNSCLSLRQHNIQLGTPLLFGFCLSRRTGASLLSFDHRSAVT